MYNRIFTHFSYVNRQITSIDVVGVTVTVSRSFEECCVIVSFLNKIYQDLVGTKNRYIIIFSIFLSSIWKERIWKWFERLQTPKNLKIWCLAKQTEAGFLFFYEKVEFFSLFLCVSWYLDSGADSVCLAPILSTYKGKYVQGGQKLQRLYVWMCVVYTQHVHTHTQIEIHKTDFFGVI